MHFLGVLALLSTTLAFSFWLTRLLSRPDTRWQVLDHPNERSLHSVPTPRTGGIAILASMVTAAIVVVLFLPYSSAERYAWLAVAVAMIAGISYMDDRVSLPAGLRFAIHWLAAAVLVVGGFRFTGSGLPGEALNLEFPVIAGLTGLYIVWMTNLYNFMDGMDGFAGGMTVIGFGALAFAGWLAGDMDYSLSAALVAFSAAGFLVFNFPPARIFMGDVGSSTLGLLAAVFTLWGAERGVLPFWAGLLVFSPFIVDATVTLIKRGLRGERVWQAHKQHYYQRLVRHGWGHRKTVLWEYLLMLVCAGCALWASGQRENVQLLVACLAMLAYSSLAIGLDRLIPSKASSAGTPSQR